MRIIPEDLYAAARELAQGDGAYLPRLGRLVAVQVRAAADEDSPKKAGTVHRIPWNGPCADVVFDIHAAVRRHESSLTLLLFGKAKFRGGTDALTLDAVTRLPVLIAHACDKGNDDHTVVQEAARALLRWPRDCRRVLDEAHDSEQPWTKAPGGLACPDCDSRLELMPGWSQSPENADVYCRTCRDEDGRYARWAPSQWTGRVLAHEPPPPTDEDGVRLVTAVEAEALGIAPAATIHVWAHRKQITPAGRTKAGGKLYRIDDLETRAARSVSA